MPSKTLVDRVCNTVRALPGWPALRVLDLSCGDGALLETLSAEAPHVEGTHFRRDDYIFKTPRAVLEKATIHQGVDLTQPLPFPAAAYDVVIATEVLEHLPAHVPLYAEMSRIMTAGGHCIVSTPNIHRLASRMQFMLTGQHELRSARLGWDLPASALYSTHYNPVYFPVLHTLLHHNNLHIRKLGFSCCKPAAFLLLPLYPLVFVATVVEARHALKRSRAGGRDLLRWMLDWRALWSDQLIVVAQKEHQVLASTLG